MRPTTIQNLTLEQPGVKAPGTAKTTPFLVPNSSARFTLFDGAPSYRATVGSLSPTCMTTVELYFSMHFTRPHIEYGNCLLKLRISIQFVNWDVVVL